MVNVLYNQILGFSNPFCENHLFEHLLIRKLCCFIDIKLYLHSLSVMAIIPSLLIPESFSASVSWSNNWSLSQSSLESDDNHLVSEFLARVCDLNPGSFGTLGFQRDPALTAGDLGNLARDLSHLLLLPLRIISESISCP